ncbi:class I SAM-dependent methyltransferase [Saccharicrinis sp. FJH2]|uniref:class I SAM-dependent methyltransferase n=1 Tax=Saccharicrinis sp. FJH65 TaxID=3344659 RepID=UPI0035F4C313
MTNKTQNFWDREAEKYDARKRQFETIFEEVIAKTKKYLHANDNVLDFGCATGEKTIKLAKTTGHIHGLDISAEMISRAIQKKNDADIRNCSFSQGTIFDNDFKNASFDAIVSYHVIHLLEDIEKVLQKIHDLLKPGSLFILTTVCLKDKMTLKKRLEIYALLVIKKLGILPINLNLLTSADLEKMMENGSFQIVESVNFFHGVTTNLIIARKL